MNSQLIDEFASVKFIQASSRHALLVHKWYMCKKKPDDMFSCAAAYG